MSILVRKNFGDKKTSQIHFVFSICTAIVQFAAAAAARDFAALQ
jgi:hypothetical protein